MHVIAEDVAQCLMQEVRARVVRHRREANGPGDPRPHTVAFGEAGASKDERLIAVEAIRLHEVGGRVRVVVELDRPGIRDLTTAGGIERRLAKLREKEISLELLELSDRYKQKHAPAAVVLGSREDGKVHLVANFDDSVATRVSASDVVRSAAAIVGGGGGGRPNMARAGGKDPEKLPDALAEAERLIVAAL
jgi:hypothetical protein